jgi:hypothetical protein
MKNAAFGVIFFCGIVVAQAAPPSDESLIKMMTALQLHNTLDQMVAQMEAGMKTALTQSIKEKELNPLQTAELGKLQSKMADTIKADLSFAKVKDVYLQVYRETFTQDEVNGIVAFCASPAGRAMLAKIDPATRKASNLLRERMGPTLQKIKIMQQDFINEHTPK